MSIEQTIKEQYVLLCQRLGDSLYKKSILDQEIQDLQNQIKGLNLANAALQEKVKSSLNTNDFLKQRRAESGASDVQVVDSLPLGAR